MNRILPGFNLQDYDSQRRRRAPMSPGHQDNVIIMESAREIESTLGRLLGDVVVQTRLHQCGTYAPADRGEKRTT